MNTIKKSILAAAIVGSFGLSTQATAEVEANIGVASNYIWRGLTQTNDQAAISGGLDYSSGGFYLGTWASNVDFGDDTANDTGYELDLYGGYGGEVGSFGYDLGYIYYAYPTQSDSDFSEVYIDGSYSVLSFGAAFMVDADFTDEDYIYLHAGVDLELSPEYGLSLYVGDVDTGDDDADYIHYGASLSKGDFSFAVDANDLDGEDSNTKQDDPRITVGWSKTF